MLVWFCIRAKLRAHTLRHPCLACPSRCTEPLYPHDHCKRTIIHRSHQPFSKPHYPSKIAITLASLVKGEVLSPEKNSGDYRRDCLTTIPRLHQPFQNSTIPLAFRRARACVCLYGFVFALPPRFPYCNRLYALICFHIRTIPCFAPSHLPPLSKGGGLTASHKLSLCCVLLAIHPPF